MNLPGMSNGAFFFKAACSTQMWPRGKSQDHHSTTAYLLLSNTHTPTDPHTHSTGTFSAAWGGDGGLKRGKLTSSWGAVATSSFCRSFYLLFTRSRGARQLLEAHGRLSSAK